MVFTLFAICITVAEVALGLALVILLFRMRRTVDGRPHRLAEGMSARAWPHPASSRCCLLARRSSLPAAGAGRAAAPLRRGRPRGSRSCARRGALAAAVSRLAARSAPDVEPGDPSWAVAARRQDGPLATVGVLVDADSTLMLLLVTLVALLVQVYSLGYLHDEPPRRARPLLRVPVAVRVLDDGPGAGAELPAALHLLGAGRPLLVPADRLLVQRPEAARAAVKAFWTTKAGDVGLLIGIVLLWRPTGTFDFSELFDDGRGRHAARRRPRRSSRSASTSARWASRRSSRCTSGCPTRWKARRRSRR